MFDDLIDEPTEEELNIEDIIAMTDVGKCSACQNYQNHNSVCSQITKVVHPDQMGCLDFIAK